MAKTKHPTATTLAGKYRQIYEGKADCMPSGLSKKDLKKSKSGKIVSKKRSARAKVAYKNNPIMKRASKAMKKIYGK